MSARQIALDRSAALVRRRYAPGGNYHPKGYYISISSLVKKTAAEHARKLLAWKRGTPEKDNVPPYWGFIGNTLGDEAFAAAWADGLALPLPLAIAEAREISNG